MNITSLTITKAREGLAKKEFSSVELTKELYKHIAERDSEIGAYLTLTKDLALEQAAKADTNIAKNDTAPLTGIPLAIKDNILVDKIRATASSKMLENYIAPYDATVITKLREAGAVFLGKTNMDEFAMGSSTENSALKKTKNPRDLTRVPGGSSGGSAAAVAGDMAIAALGSDTGGSIRQPAGFCGVVGLKPTYGTVSRYGLMAMASSLDQIGPLTKTVEDAETVFNSIRGTDPFDATSVTAPQQIAAQKNLTIGIPKEFFDHPMRTEVADLLTKTKENLAKLGHTLKEISLPHVSYSLEVYYLIMPAEVSANLARYDGIRYGHSIARDTETPATLGEVYSKSRGQGFGKEVRRRIMLGTYVLSHGYYEAYYLKAQKVRTIITNDFKHAFENQGVDAIFAPTTPDVAFKFGEKTSDPLSMYLEDIYTVPVNIAGLPAISVPAGTIDNLPFGVQFIAPWFSETTLFALGKALESTRS